MRIKEVEIIGFKSFVDKINLPFLSGITVLVGPNGCGKSNVVDAIRWAMGEQSAKHLRGRSMEDIIFNGSETRKPLGMAEVSLIFANDNGNAPAEYRAYSEIMVTRRLFRSGESEYYINKVPCRLKDITELFMDTGVGTRSYSIIEQGKVEMLINAKPLDRRVLLEEVAGVLKYKNRKREALSKIESTRQNLLRVNDILGELYTQMNSLKRQAGRLKGYQRLKERIRETDLVLSSRRYREMRVQEDEAQKQLASLRDEEIRIDAATKNVEAQLEMKKVEQYEREQSLSTAQREQFENTSLIQKCSSTIEFNQKELSEIRDRNESAIKETETLRLQMDRERAEVEELEKREGEFGDLLTNEEGRVRVKEEHINRLKDEYQEKLETIEKEKSELIDLLTEIAHCKNSQLHLEKNLDDLKRRGEKICREKEELSVRCADLKEKADILLGECNGMREKKSTLEIKKGQIELECQRMEAVSLEQEKCLKATQESIEKNRIQMHSLEELEKRYEGYTNGVRSFMSRSDRERKEGNGHCRLLADSIRTEPGYEIALEAVLGERLQSIIVKEWGEVWEGIDYLKNKTTGRGTFIPLEAHKNGNNAHSSDLPLSEAKPLLSLVEAEANILPVVQSLLRGVWVVTDLTKVLDLPASDHNRLFVTHEGELMDPSGLVTGGYKENLDSGILKRKRRIRELYKSINNLDTEYKQNEESYRKANERLIACRGELDAFNRELQELILSLVHKERDCIQAGEGLKETGERLKLLLLEEEEITSLIQETETEQMNVQALREEREQARNEREEVLASLQESLKGMEENIKCEEEEITSLKISQASLREKREHCLSLLLAKREQQNDLLSRVETIEQKVHKEEQRAQELSASLEAAEARLGELIKSGQMLEKRVEEERGITEQGIALINQMEVNLKELRKSYMEIQPGINEMNLRLNECQLNMSHLKNDIQEKYHFDLEGVWEEYSRTGEKENKDLQGYLQQLKTKLERFRDVNLMAQQELEELKKRHTFISLQQEDLQQTLESLKKVIHKINSTISERFIETFNRVNEKFKEIFPKLFRGGKAELILTSEDDILEAGIEIYAQPPGKRLQNMDLLSGGEKSMTAVSLLLALFMVKPSPFCLLDEVDSPLDDMNTLRFVDQLKEMEEDSQFILITHNKKTMESANTLYGITMEEKGVTKVVSVRLN